MKYSDHLVEWLAELGYTHCFFVAGGNIMHLLESASRKMQMVPVVHEVAAGIAAEYFNEVSESGRAFAMVTAGPGITNMVTAMAGAYLESRELLVIGGQVKVDDLNRGGVRQRGIQEIDGVAITTAVAVRAERIEAPVARGAFTALAEAGSMDRKGPVFIEIPLDVQAREVDDRAVNATPAQPASAHPPGGPAASELAAISARLQQASRPVLLLGNGIKWSVAHAAADAMAKLGVPVMTTWNGADRIAADHPLYFGRPNTWGQRYANLLLQQADLIVALGTRLGLQQTGFNWQQFAPLAQIVQVDCDAGELHKGHPRVSHPVLGDANNVFRHLLSTPPARCEDWVGFCREVKHSLPLSEPVNQTGPGYVSPHQFCLALSGLCDPGDLIVPCSSGGAFTVMMQCFNQKRGQRIITNKGLASMGYGLGGAMGAALAGNGRRTVLVEGDGGFAQNLQELGTAAIHRLNLKIFIFDNNGYASIRMTQRNYFGGRYVGCDGETGVGLPDWEQLFKAFRIPVQRLAPHFEADKAFLAAFSEPGLAAFIVPLDPEQTYLPKISSRLAEGGGMVSDPLHMMSPHLDQASMARLGRYLPKTA